MPGAIRLVLAKNPSGLLTRDLAAKVAEIRPDTPDTAVFSALTPMLRRNEVARNGFHKNYTYMLVETAMKRSAIEGKGPAGKEPSDVGG